MNLHRIITSADPFKHDVASTFILSLPLSIYNHIFCTLKYSFHSPSSGIRGHLFVAIHPTKFTSIPLNSSPPIQLISSLFYQLAQVAQHSLSGLCLSTPVQFQPFYYINSQLMLFMSVTSSILRMHVFSRFTLLLSEESSLLKLLLHTTLLAQISIPQTTHQSPPSIFFLTRSNCTATHEINSFIHLDILPHLKA